MVQAIIVGICVLVALWFMGRKMYRTMRSGRGCSCDCEKCNSGLQNTESCVSCHGKRLQELRPK